MIAKNRKYESEDRKNEKPKTGPESMRLNTGRMRDQKQEVNTVPHNQPGCDKQISTSTAFMRTDHPRGPRMAVCVVGCVDTGTQ